MLFSMLTAERLHLVPYFSTEYHNPREKIIILFWKYLVNINKLGLVKSFFGIHLYCLLPVETLHENL
jgi:hypothetical protein